MSMIDYGALLRVDGKFINRGEDLFMDAADTGYVCKEAGGEIIDGNYYVYAGDDGLLLCFYKTQIAVVSGDKIIRKILDLPFAAETFSGDFGKIAVEHLDRRRYPTAERTTWEDYAANVYATPIAGYVPLNRLQHGKKVFKRYLNGAKRRRRSRETSYTNRYLATWDYGGRHYEVIFGYGIDPSPDTWADIRDGDAYSFTETERKIIDDWFNANS